MSVSKEDIRKYGEPYINEDLLEKVLKVRQNELLHEDDWKIWEKELDVNEQRYLSQFCRQLENFSQNELAVATIVAVRNFPEMVFQIVMEEYLSMREKEKKNGST